MRFDPEQEKAIHHADGPMMVLAGPGSGKTTVLTNRISFLHKTAGVPERNILVLTFTRKAAEEMKERYMVLEGKDRTQVTFGTFHSVFLHILSEHSGKEKLHVIEKEEGLFRVERILKSIYGKDFTPGLITETVYDDIGKIKNGMSVANPLAKEVYPLLKEEMNRFGEMDFDDMLSSCLGILLSDTEYLKALRNRFRYILVDEFQDVNRVQYEILKLISRPGNNLFIVGDDDQSIYGFRGSDPAFMKRFLKDYRGAKKVLLKRNHRSTKHIVKASLKLIGHNKNRFRKHLISVNKGGMQPAFAGFDNAKEEAEYIEKWVLIYLEAARKAGLPDPQFALLARTKLALKEINDYLNDEILKYLSLLTFHSSKGLEFDVVFIGAANEGVTPQFRADERKELEEERRAFYVAMTRAKRYLHILNTKHSYNKTNERTRFVKEISSIF